MNSYPLARFGTDPDDGRVIIVCAICDELVAHPDNLEDALLGWDGHWDEAHS